ncbi:IMP dehydrogenase [Saprospira grandis]|uniref:GMP reductase n=1 Tax=Saprospira grandis (strain Lewin) TaxID=984262 RepID=H6L5X9_SAPGL|nr:IMP dehydrogenase [Saprospira grandis]AFC26539.1 guanosine 5'-monophosphate oxidoreductase [Saprospira grandis str. Lewin]
MIKTAYHYDDLMILPALEAHLNSRTDCIPHYASGQLPFFAAPMSTVVAEQNYQFFLEQGLNVCFPRYQNLPPNFFDLQKQYKGQLFLAMDLEEFNKEFLVLGKKLNRQHAILIDTANGHLQRVYELCLAAKKEYGEQMLLMAGNIGHPRTFERLAETGVDYLRLGIGGGRNCSTSSFTGVHYPLASLIIESRKLAQQLPKAPKIIADGGIGSYANAIMALACGADYVMMGSLINQALESAGQSYLFKQIPLSQNLAKLAFRLGLPLYKEYKALHSRPASAQQGLIGRRAVEGRRSLQKVQYQLPDFLFNLGSYLQSAMSYTGKIQLEDFIGQVELITDRR